MNTAAASTVMGLKDCIETVAGWALVPAANIGMEEHRIEAAADATDAIDAPLPRSAPRQTNRALGKMQICLVTLIEYTFPTWAQSHSCLIKCEGRAVKE